MTTATAGRARGLLDGPGDRVRNLVPAGTVRAALAGGEAALLGWLTVVVPAVAAYVATATAPALGEATWWQAAVVGSSLWRLAHGGAVTLAGEAISLAPLGLSLLAVGLVVWSARRARLRTWAGLLALTAGYVAVGAPLAGLPPTSVGGWGAPVLGAALVGLAGGLIALRRAATALPPPDALVAAARRIPEPERTRVRAMARAVAVGTATAIVALVAVGLVLVVTSLVAHLSGISAALGALSAGGMSRAMAVLAMLLYLPTAVVWAIAWLAGPGFAVGAGTVVAPGGVMLGPLPAVPAFAALPEPGTLGAGLPWAPGVLLGIGALAGWRIHRRAPQQRWWEWIGAAVGTAAATGLLARLLASVASGAIGPGRMAELGPEPSAVALAAACWLAGGALLVLVPAAARGKGVPDHPADRGVLDAGGPGDVPAAGPRGGVGDAAARAASSAQGVLRAPVAAVRGLAVRARGSSRPG